MKRLVWSIGVCLLWGSWALATQDSGAPEDALLWSPERLPQVSGMAADIQRAAQISATGLLQAIAHVRSARPERELREVLVGALSRGSAEELPFEPIVGAGENSLTLHHRAGDDRLVPGGLLLLDVGARYRGGCADLTRTLPVSGRFSPRQRAIYQLVLAAQQEVARVMKPGVHSLDEMTDLVLSIFRKSPLRARDRRGVLRTLDAFFPHALGHYLGRQVHGEDLGLDTALPIQPGQVIAIEPGLYLEGEGFGIRIEDDYLVTATGLVELLPSLPKTAAEIEKLMASSRIPFYEAPIGPDLSPLFVRLEPTIRARLRT